MRPLLGRCPALSPLLQCVPSLCKPSPYLRLSDLLTTGPLLHRLGLLLPLLPRRLFKIDKLRIVDLYRPLAPRCIIGGYDRAL